MEEFVRLLYQSLRPFYRDGPHQPFYGEGAWFSESNNSIRVTSDTDTMLCFLASRVRAVLSSRPFITNIIIA